MKGKKLDQEFIGQYISDCISKNITSSSDMVFHAQERINEIDTKIKEVEFLKLERAKLLDVIYSFHKSESTDNKKEINRLALYKISNPNLCRLICENLNKLEIKDMYGYSKLDVLSSIKQLIEHKVLFKSGSRLIRGELFDEYCSSILKMDIT